MYVTHAKAKQMMLRGFGDGGISSALDPNTPPDNPDASIQGDVGDVTVSSGSPSLAPLLIILAVVALLYWLSKKD